MTDEKSPADKAVDAVMEAIGYGESPERKNTEGYEKPMTRADMLAIYYDPATYEDEDDEE